MKFSRLQVMSMPLTVKQFIKISQRLHLVLLFFCCSFTFIHYNRVTVDAIKSCKHVKNFYWSALTFDLRWRVVGGCRRRTAGNESPVRSPRRDYGQPLNSPRRPIKDHLRLKQLSLISGRFLARRLSLLRRKYFDRFWQRISRNGRDGDRMRWGRGTGGGRGGGSIAV